VTASTPRRTRGTSEGHIENAPRSSTIAQRSAVGCGRQTSCYAVRTFRHQTGCCAHTVSSGAVEQRRRGPEQHRAVPGPSNVPPCSESHKETEHELDRCKNRSPGGRAAASSHVHHAGVSTPSPCLRRVSLPPSQRGTRRNPRKGRIGGWSGENTCWRSSIRSSCWPPHSSSLPVRTQPRIPRRRPAPVRRAHHVPASARRKVVGEVEPDVYVVNADGARATSSRCSPEVRRDGAFSTAARSRSSAATTEWRSCRRCRQRWRSREAPDTTLETLCGLFSPGGERLACEGY
jgi:hypothetical protein